MASLSTASPAFLFTVSQSSPAGGKTGNSSGDYKQQAIRVSLTMTEWSAKTVMCQVLRICPLRVYLFPSQNWLWNSGGNWVHQIWCCDHGDGLLEPDGLGVTQSQAAVHLKSSFLSGGEKGLRAWFVLQKEHSKEQVKMQRREGLLTTESHMRLDKNICQYFWPQTHSIWPAWGFVFIIFNFSVFERIGIAYNLNFLSTMIYKGGSSKDWVCEPWIWRCLHEIGKDGLVHKVRDSQERRGVLGIIRRKHVPHSGMS